MKSNKNILIRVDASVEIGTGHVMRCLLLADNLQKYVSKIRFVSRHMLESLQQTILSHGYEFVHLQYECKDNFSDDLKHSPWLGVNQLEDVEATKNVVADSVWDWIIVDHYALDYRWESAFKEMARIFVIDDLADRKHICDYLLDQNMHQNVWERYSGLVNEDCELLLGPEYSLLRDEFRIARESAVLRDGQVTNVLVFFGGVDKDNYTGRTLSVLAAYLDKNIQVDVVIGSNHVAREQITALCEVNGYMLHVQIANISELMHRADLAIGAGGTAVWERCSLGLPSICFSLANNQNEQLESAANFGLLIFPDVNNDFENTLLKQLHALMENSRLRKYISNKCLKSIGVYGLVYVLSNMGFTGIHIRNAEMNDSDQLYTWRNHPDIRKYSTNQSAISKSEHDTWFNSSLKNNKRYILVGEIKDIPIGIIRFDISDNTAMVSIYLGPNFVSKGYGHRLLRAAELWCKEEIPVVKSIEAVILQTNSRSERLFERSGYKRKSSTYIKRLAMV